MEKIAGVAKLAELVEYQKGSIVSRMILSKQQGSVTLFALDQGQIISEHTTPFDALANVIEGEAEIIIANKSYTVKAEEILVMPANVPHAVKARQQFKMLLTMIKS